MMVPRATADRLLEKHKIVQVGRARTGAAGPRKQTAAEKAAALKARIRTRAADLALLAVRARVGKALTVEQGRAVIKALLGHCLNEARAQMLRLRAPGAKRSEASKLDGLATKLDSPEAQMKFIVEFAICNSSYTGLYDRYAGGYASGLVGCARAFKVDLKRVEAAARKELLAAAKGGKRK